MTKGAKLTIGAGLLALLGAVAAYNLFLRDPFLQPGQSWKNDTPFSWELLRLLDSGRYVARVWCDVCPVTEVFGTWSRDGKRITLRPDRTQDAVRELIEVESNGCRLLAHPKGIDTDGAVNPLMAHLREGEPCEFRPSGYARKL